MDNTITLTVKEILLIISISVLIGLWIYHTIEYINYDIKRKQCSKIEYYRNLVLKAIAIFIFVIFTFKYLPFEKF